jgi:hypothetical protein
MTTKYVVYTKNASIKNNIFFFVNAETYLLAIEKFQNSAGYNRFLEYTIADVCEYYDLGLHFEQITSF